MGPGANALRARWSKTDESLPIEYSITGFLNAAAVSLKISMDSFSRALKTEDDLITSLIVVWGLLPIGRRSCKVMKIPEDLGFPESFSSGRACDYG